MHAKRLVSSHIFSPKKETPLDLHWWIFLRSAFHPTKGVPSSVPLVLQWFAACNTWCRISCRYGKALEWCFKNLKKIVHLLSWQMATCCTLPRWSVMLPPPHEKREGMAKRVGSYTVYGIRSKILKGSENPQIYYTKLACLLQEWWSLPFWLCTAAFWDLKTTFEIICILLLFSCFSAVSGYVILDWHSGWIDPANYLSYGKKRLFLSLIRSFWFPAPFHIKQVTLSPRPSLVLCFWACWLQGPDACSNHRLWKLTGPNLQKYVACLALKRQKLTSVLHQSMSQHGNIQHMVDIDAYTSIIYI